MNIKKITLQIFFPAMYLCAGFVLIAIWGESFIEESYFRLIPTFFVIGLASIITWLVLVIKEFLNIAKGRK